jgi:hypothetical protein
MIDRSAMHNAATPGRAGHGQAAHGGDPDAVFMAHRKTDHQTVHVLDKALERANELLP